MSIEFQYGVVRQEDLHDLGMIGVEPIYHRLGDALADRDNLNLIEQRSRLDADYSKFVVVERAIYTVITAWDPYDPASGRGPIEPEIVQELAEMDEAAKQREEVEALAEANGTVLDPDAVETTSWLPVEEQEIVPRPEPEPAPKAARRPAARAKR